MIKKRTIAVVTTSRADYGHLYWPLKDLFAHPEVDLKIIALGPHLSPEFGHTVDEIEQDGFLVAERIECLLSSDADVGMAKSIGIAVLVLTDALPRIKPNLRILLPAPSQILPPPTLALPHLLPMS